MHKAIEVCLAQPQNALKVIYTTVIRLIILICNRFLQPWIDNSVDIRTDLVRCFLSAIALHLPELFFAADGDVSPKRARPVNGKKFNAFIVPGHRDSEITGLKAAVVMLFFHGGGFIAGEALMYMPTYERWVRKAQEKYGLDLVVIPVEYRLLGEARYPACLEDAVASYVHVLRELHIPSRRIVIAGDSAGGCLCTMLNLELKRLSIDLPAATILISPWLDLSLSNTAYSPGQYTDFVAVIPRNKSVVDAFLPEGISDTDPLVSPLFADASGLGPQIIFAGDTECLFLDSLDFHRKCVSSGVDSELKVGRGQMHTYALGGILASTATENATDKSILEFIRKQVNVSTE